MVTTTEQKRTPRFQRVSTINFRLQNRDIEIIKQIYKHRFLTSDHLKALAPKAVGKMFVIGELILTPEGPEFCCNCVCFQEGDWVDHSHCVDPIFYNPRDVLPRDGKVKGCRNWRKTLKP
jgi:hypothetical protein